MPHRADKKLSDEHARLVEIAMNHDCSTYAEDAPFRKSHRESLERLPLEKLKELVSHYDEESTIS